MCEEPSKFLVDPKNIKRISLTEKSAFWVLTYSPGYSPVKRRHARAMPRSREGSKEKTSSLRLGLVVLTVLTLGVVCLQYKP